MNPGVHATNTAPLHLLTATGARPQAWAICQRLMAAQDYTGPVHWVIVDDGPVKQAVTFERAQWTLDRLRVVPTWQVGQNTQARNLLAGLEFIPPGERLVIIEDDDWYAADWLTTVAQQLEGAQLVGEQRAKYYNLKTRRARQLNNNRHASLCSTAMHGPALTTFAKVCRTRAKFIDMNLWKLHRHRQLFDGDRVVGIKGLPGRPGIGIGHDAGFHGTDDPNFELLRQWTGADAQVYIDHAKNSN